MVLAIPVLLFFGFPFYAGAWKGTWSGRNNIDRLVALTTSVAFLFSVFNTFFPDYWLGACMAYLPETQGQGPWPSASRSFTSRFSI